MSIRSLRWPAVCAIALVCAGCRLNSLSFSYHDDDYHHRPHVVTRVHTGHVCHSGCHDHYWDGGRVVVLSGHRHGPSCGHYWDGSHWSISAKHVTRVHKVHKPTKIKIKTRRHRH